MLGDEPSAGNDETLQVVNSLDINRVRHGGQHTRPTGYSRWYWRYACGNDGGAISGTLITGAAGATHVVFACCLGAITRK